jgi:mono/diheme cytochrome c family protein
VVYRPEAAQRCGRFPAVLLGLTTDQKLGLAGTATVFIVFALVCALLIPRYRPDFPGGRGLSLFIVLTAILTVAMLGAVEVWAKEEEHAATETRETTGEETETTETSPTGQTTPATTTTAEEEPSGDPEAGKAVFASSGCGGCHVFAAAGSSGSVGPNLDESLEGKDAEYVQRAIEDPNADVAEGYQPGIMPSFDQLSDDQVNDLVAFLTES